MFGKFRFIGLFRYSSVIASQCAHWRGNPRNIPETLGDCHVGLRPPRNDELFGEQFVKSEFAIVSLTVYLKNATIQKTVFGKGEVLCGNIFFP